MLRLSICSKWHNHRFPNLSHSKLGSQVSLQPYYLLTLSEFSVICHLFTHSNRQLNTNQAFWMHWLLQISCMLLQFGSEGWWLTTVQSRSAVNIKMHTVNNGTLYRKCMIYRWVGEGKNVLHLLVSLLYSSSDYINNWARVQVEPLCVQYLTVVCCTCADILWFLFCMAGEDTQLDQGNIQVGS